MTSSPAIASMPSTQVLRVERHGQLGALVLGVELLVGLADVLGDRLELEPVGAHRQPHRCGLAGEQPHTADRLEQRLSPDVSRFG